jgi:RNA-binding protein
MSLSNKQKRFLRGLTHGIHPLVTVADKGLTETVRNELETALAFHELVKIRIRCERAERAAHIDTISADFHCELVHAIGQVASFYRANPKQPKIDLTGAGAAGFG